jgi:hypothetical protein
LPRRRLAPATPVVAATPLSAVATAAPPVPLPPVATATPCASASHALRGPLLRPFRMPNLADISLENGAVFRAARSLACMRPLGGTQLRTAGCEWGARAQRLGCYGETVAASHPSAGASCALAEFCELCTRQRLPGLSRKGTSASGDFKVTTQCAACPRSSKRCSHAGLSKEACCVISK